MKVISECCRYILLPFAMFLVHITHVFFHAEGVSLCGSACKHTILGQEIIVSPDFVVKETVTSRENSEALIQYVSR